MDYILRITVQFLTEILPKTTSYLNVGRPEFRWRYVFSIVIVIASVMLNVMMFGKILSIGSRLVTCQQSKGPECVSECQKELELLSKICIRSPDGR